MYGTDLGDDLVARKRSWRWFLVRLAGLVARDTATATLLAADLPQQRVWTPQAVGDQLRAWANAEGG